ncbi:MAG: hypothetical protein QXG11_07295 [Candidatus Bathyarchaeia archaeon]
MLNLKYALLLIGYAVFLFWSAVLAFAFISYTLGHSIPEILISPESSLSFLSYFILLREFHFPLKRGEKYWKFLFAYDVGLGIFIIMVGAYTIIFVNPNPFAFLCLIMGASIILIHKRHATKWKCGIVQERDCF